VRVVPCTIVVFCLLVSIDGCQLFGKKSGGDGGGGTFLGAKNNDKPKDTKPADPLVGGMGNNADLDGVLAGRVIDGAGQPADAQIRWVCMDEPKQAEVPIDVAVNAQGYFMIQGLKSGKNYKLITRAKSGDKTLEVVTLAQASDVHLLIHVNERFNVPNSPDKGKKSAGSTKEQPASAQIPLPRPPWQEQNPATLPPVETFGDKSRIANETAVIIKPPLADVPSQPPSSAPAVTITPPIAQSQFSVPTGPIPVPSSIKVGLRLENFALYDLRLARWELKREATGKLVLLDFWKTTCPPCLQEITTLNVLTSKYRAQGLEVVGIAYEDQGELLSQAHRVEAVAQRWHASYQVLLGGGPGCPLKRDLNVRAYPTLVLLDENGVVVWQHEGALDAVSREHLEFAIKRRLAPY
jgi:thiol-disulfide isomerase/thioredoxin